jgi:anthranilate phosphoribosyltransferase
MLAECAAFLLERAVPVPLDGIDVCGTGGSGAAKTFNVSTASAFVLAAGGVSVVKHGNRAVTSTSGSSDVLDSLGVSVATDPAQAAAQYEGRGLCFLSAPAFHPALAGLAPVRKAVGRPTFFNLLGPLCNPARVKRQVIGVYSRNFLHPVAEAAKYLGKTDIMVVHSDDGRDEFSLESPARYLHLANGNLREGTRPADSVADASILKDGGPAANAKAIESVFAGETGPRRDAICLNAAAGFIVAGIAKDMAEGVALAQEAVASGAALRKLDAMRGRA